MRERKGTTGGHDSKMVTGRIDAQEDVRSQRSNASGMQRSMSSAAAAARMIHSMDGAKQLPVAISKPSVRGPNTLEGKLIFEDPSAVLNLTEDGWNEIVQQNLKKFEEDKVN